MSAPTATTHHNPRYAALVRAFHRYGAWLVKMSWWRFFGWSLLLLIATGILSDLPPFTWKRTETVVEDKKRDARPVKAPNERRGDGKSLNISIDEKGVRITKGKAADEANRPLAGQAPASEGAAAPSTSDTPTPSPSASTPPNTPAAPQAQAAESPGAQITITVPGPHSDEVRLAIDEAKAAIAEAIAQATDDDDEPSPRKRVMAVRTSIGDALPNFALLWVLGSAILKATYKGQLRAEARATVASETAEAETLKRHVVEARMAAMQAQVEPHFLFNTLASIDHLIETDPPRASKMQKDLIAMLRASMPTMREPSATGLRALGSEMAVVRPYLAILKVRMDERLDATIDVPEGLNSAAFPPMMLQSLVENAVKHGLEPKAEGGSLRVKAEVVDGALVVSVADTGLGFGRADTQGTGVGLANIRERLALLYGNQAQLVMTANTPTGTVASVTVPYRSVASTGAAPGSAANAAPTASDATNRAA